VVDWRLSALELAKDGPGIPPIVINRVEVRNASSSATRIECLLRYPL
jgi:hypothetical protein